MQLMRKQRKMLKMGKGLTDCYACNAIQLMAFLFYIYEKNSVLNINSPKQN